MIKIEFNDGKIDIYDDKIYFSFYFFADEFVCESYLDSPLIVNDDDILYDIISSIMNFNYFFYDNGLSNKINDKLVWLSDQYGDLEDKEITDKISRLVIEKDNNSYKMYCYNPFMLMNNIKRKQYVSFSPGGNGKSSCNMLTGSTFQDDIVNNFYYSILEKKKIMLKK